MMYRRTLLTLLRSQCRCYSGQSCVITTSPRLAFNILRRKQLHGAHIQALRYISGDKSKVEETLRMLKDDLQMQKTTDDIYSPELVDKKKVVKLPLKTRLWEGCLHYYHGFRLLALETTLSAKYVFRVARGHSLMRRERQQLIRTLSDLFRLVPFSVFVIVPFMELTLPIFLKLFPNMLPSTFQEASKQEQKMRTRLKVNLEMAKFLQETLGEMALERKLSDGKPVESKAAEFAEFMRTVRSQGGYVTNAELFKFTKLFEDELTLDSLPMNQLRALCRILGIQPLGNEEILRFQLQLKLRELKADDKQIALEGGVDCLTIPDMQQACRARGMRSLGMSEQRLKDQLQQWLELSLNDKVPPALLLMSRALYLPEDISFTERLKRLLSALPEGIAEQTRQKLTELEGNKVDHKARLEMIKSVEDAILLERKAEEERKTREVELAKAKKLKEEAIAAATEVAQPPSVTKTEPATETAPPTLLEKLVSKTAAPNTPFKETEAVVEAGNVMADERTLDSAHQVDKKDLESIENVIHGSVVMEAKHDISELKEKSIELSEDLLELDALVDNLAESKGAVRLRDRVNHIISNVDKTVAKLEAKKRAISELIADPSVEGEDKLKDESLVRVDDLLASLNRLKKYDIKRENEQIAQVVRALDDDTDGLIDVKIVLKLIDLMNQHKDVKVSAAQIKQMVEILRKEEEMEALEAFFSGKAPFPPVHSSYEDDHSDLHQTVSSSFSTPVNISSSTSSIPEAAETHIPPNTQLIEKAENSKGVDISTSVKR